MRNFSGVDLLRKAAFEDIDKAVVIGIDSTIRYILARNGLLHLDTVNTRNWFLLNTKTED